MSLQSERIKWATERSALERNRYTEDVVRAVTEDLNKAEEQVKRTISQYQNLESLPDNKLKAKRGFERLQAEIQEIMKVLKRDQTMRFRRSMKESFKLGITSGVDELVKVKWPSFESLQPKQVNGLAKDMFSLIDRDALDFMVNYSVVLAGDVQRELADGIKRTLMSGIALGKGADDIVRDLGNVVKDPESFRRAGNRVFSKAQYRMTIIARTEVIRAHNQGRMKYHREVGVQRLEWLTVQDERTCPVCGPLHGKEFAIDKIPSLPIHPQCRCTSVVALPVKLLSPDQIRKKATARARDHKVSKQVFEHGDAKDLEALSTHQLHRLSKENGISRKRTKHDLIELLDRSEPGVEHRDLAGAPLAAKLKQHSISRDRTKAELVRLLSKKQKAVRAAQDAAEVERLKPSAGLYNLSFKELKKLAQDKNISPYLTRDEVVEMLDELEPDRNHGTLDSQELVKAKKRHGLGRHKTKKHFIRALEKLAGEQLLATSHK